MRAWKHEIEKFFEVIPPKTDKNWKKTINNQEQCSNIQSQSLLQLFSVENYCCWREIVRETSTKTKERRDHEKKESGKR